MTVQVSQIRKYFKFLPLWREDIRQELDLIGLPENVSKICDFGCGQGLTTFTLALEIAGAECTGFDKFSMKSHPSESELQDIIEGIIDYCKEYSTPITAIPGALCQLAREKRLPQFRKGDVVLGKNLPSNVDLAYVKRLFINIFQRKCGNTPSGEEGLLAAINHISNSIHSKGYLFVVEYKGVAFEQYFQSANMTVINQGHFTRNDIRSKGRTSVISEYTYYLCQRY